MGEPNRRLGEAPVAPSRRRWLKAALALGGVAAAGGGLFGLAWRRGTPAKGLLTLTDGDKAVVEAIADAWFPGSAGVPAAGTVNVAAHVDRYLVSLPDTLSRGTKLLLRAIEWGALPGTLGVTRFSKQPREVRLELLDAWEESSIYARRMGFLSLKLAIGMAYFDEEGVRRAIGFTACPPPSAPVGEWL